MYIVILKLNEYDSSDQYPKHYPIDRHKLRLLTLTRHGKADDLTPDSVRTFSMNK